MSKCRIAVAVVAGFSVKFLTGYRRNNIVQLIPPLNFGGGRRVTYRWLLLFMNTIVYVDGFNLYYGALRNSPYKWLNLNDLFLRLLPKNNVTKIRYFTARVKPRRNDPSKASRQQAYINALSTLNNIEIHYGHYLASKPTMPTENPQTKEIEYRKVYKSEEKGSDVNLATYLLLDSFKKLCDIAVIVSNDSDLLTPIKLVKSEFNIKVGLVNPQKRPSQALKKQADFFKIIRANILKTSQFPDKIKVPNKQKTALREIHKPRDWYQK